MTWSVLLREEHRLMVRLCPPPNIYIYIYIYMCRSRLNDFHVFHWWSMEKTYSWILITIYSGQSLTLFPPFIAVPDQTISNGPVCVTNKMSPPYHFSIHQNKCSHPEDGGSTFIETLEHLTTTWCQNTEENNCKINNCHKNLNNLQAKGAWE